ncbi:AAA family ATPase [Aequorivita sp. H23M31]|uniref:AAA family ATPase n=1 Tax=Aequorivita ciconiae TaxID=2494375 RepID=A0A410G6F3_9FLAO|nr:AAA family ATPase [Aequorivita sp. H23M31]QAA82801.1 AAA family ATPase [Aequorivita sp. H23M31]
MEELKLIQENLFRQLSPFRRYLSEEIDWSDRLIAVKGARGTGKTTLLLQRIKFDLSEEDRTRALYVTLDDLYFLENTLIQLATEFSLSGGKFLFLDEVHKYPRWSRELKLIYDRFPSLFVVFTSSSMLDILSGESDLSRRAVSYTLQELSYREFLALELESELPVFSFEELINQHQEISQLLKEKLEYPLKHFEDYLFFGAYPYFKENRKTYSQKLLQTLMLIIENDMNAVENISFEESRKIKKLLMAIAQSAPFTPNISKLSERLGMNRKSLLNAIRLLGRADLVIELFKSTTGIGVFTKPEKLYLHNSNIIYAMDGKNFNMGAVRETFFANQVSKNETLHLADKADFLVNKKYVFEVGGKSKTGKQIPDSANAYIVRDQIEFGTAKTIPLWLFGFLY